jgi:hypothetical protein
VTQLSVILACADGQWTLHAAVGEPGTQHARDVIGSAVVVPPSAARDITETVAEYCDRNIAEVVDDFGLQGDTA